MKGILFARVTIAGLTLLSGPALSKTCPIEGDAKQQLARELNPFKNRDKAPTAQEINASATLDAILAPGKDLDRWSRNSAAVLEGYVVGVKIGGIESVNCHAKDAPHRDTHIELALSASAKPTERVIVEVTPRWREKMSAVADWSTIALKKQLMPGGVPQQVRITGWLFDDLEHEPQAENTNPGAAGNWRATVWEIHPITGIELLSGAAASPAAVAPAAARNVHHRSKRKASCKTSGRVCHRTVHKRMRKTA